MKHRRHEEILKRLIDVTKAEEVKATEGEIEELRELREQETMSEVDRVRSRVVLENQRREQELLKQARGEITGT